MLKGLLILRLSSVRMTFPPSMALVSADPDELPTGGRHDGSNDSSTAVLSRVPCRTPGTRLHLVGVAHNHAAQSRTWLFHGGAHRRAIRTSKVTGPNEMAVTQ